MIRLRQAEFEAKTFSVSAVGRQHTGFEDKLKYRDPLTSAATLGYGLCCNHVFHNGNKRSALVAMMCHLDKNDLAFRDDITQDALYKLMLNIADHKFAPSKHSADSTDVEVESIARWLSDHTRKVDRKERLVSYRELRRILRKHDIELEDPKGNRIDLVKYSSKISFLKMKRERLGKRIGNIPYPGDNQVIGKPTLKYIREICKLTMEDGYDSDTFYAGSRDVDYFVMKYRGLLRRLART